MKNTIPAPRAAVAGCNRRAPEESLRFIPILIPADHLPDMTRIAAHMGAMMIKVLALGWALSLGAWRWLKRNAERRRAAAALLASDPHILRDIGIEREDVFLMVYGRSEQPKPNVRKPNVSQRRQQRSARPRPRKKPR